MISNKTKLELVSAIQVRDSRRVGQIVDLLRFGRRMNYSQCYALARELTGISGPEWEELLYEADCMEGAG